MYRAIHSTSARRVPAQFISSAGRVTRRRLTTQPPSGLTASSSSISAPKKKRNYFRRFVFTAAGLTGSFYVGSTFAAFNNQAYYDFFSEQVPGGQSMLEFAEANQWDKLTIEDAIDTTSDAIVSFKRFVTDTINGTSTPSPIVESARQAAEKRTKEAKESAKKALIESRARAQAVLAELKTTVHHEVKGGEEKLTAIAKHQVGQITDALDDVVKKAEDALAGKGDAEKIKVEAVDTTPKEPSTSVDEAPTEESSDKNIYNAPLPVGFEPPPGYTRPAPPKKLASESKAAPEPFSLPLVSPAVSSFETSEPIITHLAGTIDNLASYLASNPSVAAKATDVLETAKSDLTALAERIDKAREEERYALETKLDEQTREYSLKLMELEMEAQDKLDHQEEGFRKFFEEERAKFIAAYRARLDYELKTQTELINERLKEEVIAQGIELQRRWIREIKVRVEQERGGRLAKLDELSANLKRLESIALDNSSYLDENIRVHSLWSSIRALHHAALSNAERKPFREELRRLRYISGARDDPVIHEVLSSLEATPIPDQGVDPLAELTTWFTSRVAPELAYVALVPEENAGVLSYLASRGLSYLRFRREGLAEGDDVLSRVARAEWYLNESDLDSAARELNQLKGPAKTIVSDWLAAARKRLEVQQALEAVETQATLASLLII